MKKFFAIALVACVGMAHAGPSVSIGISAPGVYLGYSTPQNYYVPPPVYVNPPQYYAPPPVYVNPPNYYGRPGHHHGYRPHGRPYQPICTTYYTQRGPRTECI